MSHTSSYRYIYIISSTGFVRRFSYNMGWCVMLSVVGLLRPVKNEEHPAIQKKMQQREQERERFIMEQLQLMQ
jgi:hypothetical protein